MNYKVLAIPPFGKQVKRLAQKYPSLKEELVALIERLEKKPQQGTSLGRNCYKIRLSIASKGKGKSGGARLITNIVVSKSTVYLLTIYDKSEKENLSLAELRSLLSSVPE